MTHMRTPYFIFITITVLLPNISYGQTCNDAISASTPFAQFTIHDDGTVTDDKTALMWKQCVEGQSGDLCTGTAKAFTWEKALQEAENINAGAGFAGHTNWRVPNIKELATIVEEKCNNPAINEDIFPNVTSSHSLWSSSPMPESDKVYSYIDMTTGKISGEKFRTANAKLRLVRDASN